MVADHSLQVSELSNWSGEFVQSVYSKTFPIFKRDFDNLANGFMKTVLGVRTQTPTLAVFGELGRLPLSVIMQERALKYWIKIMTNQQMPMYSMFIEQCNSTNVNSWSQRIKRLLDRLGLSNVWLNFDPNIDYYSTIKQRLYDQYVQNWTESIQNVSKLM